MLQPPGPLVAEDSATLVAPRLAKDVTTLTLPDAPGRRFRPEPAKPPRANGAVSGLELLVATATFRPYGERLLSPAGAGWLLIVTVLVLIMASAEGIAWGRMMSQLSEGPLMPAFGVCAGLAVFVIVWGIDATLMTLDVAAPSIERRLYGRTASPWMSRLSLLGGYLLRIGIVSGSLWLTAPQLADMLFTTDIEHVVDLKRKQIIDGVRSEVASQDAAREAALREQLWNDRNLLEDELAGRSSGRRGYGPIARTIEARIATAEAELDRIVSARESEVEALSGALETNDAERLQSQWGIVLPTDSAAERRKALEELSQDPSFAAAERSIQGFLILIFVSLFAAKLFQPRAIKIYLSGALQDEYCRYLAGEFDGWLPEHERPRNAAHAMTPYRFEDLMMNTLPEVRAADLRRRERQLRREHLAMQLTDIETVDADLQRHLTKARREEARLHERLAADLRSVEDSRSVVQRLTRDEALQRSAFQEAFALERGANPDDVVALARSKAVLKETWQATQLELNEAAADLRTAERRADRARQEHAVLAREVDVLEQQIARSAHARQAHRNETLRAAAPQT
ncbi:MAG: DUF4407 domain-containing protein [Myxococcota bacterium]